MIHDPFENAGKSLIAPCSECFEIAPDDVQELPKATRAIYIGTGGDLVLRSIDSDADVVLKNTISGSILDIRVQAVRATGTSASDLVGLL